MCALIARKVYTAGLLIKLSESKTMENSLDSIIKDIYASFCEELPNGILLKWNTNRFYNDFKKIFSDYEVINQTDFNYSYCNSYDIILEKNEKNKTILTVKVSYVSKAFALHIIRYFDRTHGKILYEDSSRQYKTSANLIKNYLIKKGFREISGEEQNIEIKNINLELAELATLGKCLFDDF